MRNHPSSQSAKLLTGLEEIEKISPRELREQVRKVAKIGITATGIARAAVALEKQGREWLDQCNHWPTAQRKAQQYQKTAMRLRRLLYK